MKKFKYKQRKDREFTYTEFSEQLMDFIIKNKYKPSAIHMKKEDYHKLNRDTAYGGFLCSYSNIPLIVEGINLTDVFKKQYTYEK